MTYEQARADSLRREKVFAQEIRELCVKHNALLHNDGAAGMWFEMDPELPEVAGSEYNP